MSTGTEAKATIKYDEFISDRLSKVRSFVKIRDVASGILVWLVGLLAFTLTMAVVDHWLFDLGLAGRLLGFAALVFWTLALFTWRIVPATFRTINPAYAAKVLEESEPSLGNSLLNLVFFRAKRNQMKEVVYRTVESDTVKRLAPVHVEDAVDQSIIIRAAITLTALMMIFGVYTALSPKSPLQTLARIAAPWLKLSRPARVRIREVEPGDADVYFGRSLSVHARVERMAADEPVRLYFSTADEQIIDRELRMQFDQNTGRHQVVVASDGDGIRRALSYRIEAGDAVAGPFQVQVVPAPSIVIDRIEYDFPEYTDLPTEVVEGVGDISALEGTRVTVFATANQVIASAYIEFDAADANSAATRDTISMDHQGDTTQGQFTLLLAPDRKSPVRKDYRLRFVNQDNDSNSLPIRHDIHVTPDLVPEVSVLQPRKRETEVPENSSVPLRIRALDPDFKLSSVKLHAVADGEPIATKELLDEPLEGAFVKELRFTPRRVGLRSGDVAVIWATAADNRRQPVTNAPAPNSAKSHRFVIRVTDPVEQPTPDENQADGADGATDPNGMGEESNGKGDGNEPTDNEDNTAGEPNGDGASQKQNSGDEQRNGQSPNSNTPNENPGSQPSSSPQQPSTNGGDQGASENNAPQSTPGNEQGPAGVGESQPSENSEPLANDGSQDGDAFERILDRMREQQEGDQQGEGNGQENQQQSEGQQQGEQRDRQQNADDSQNQGEQGQQQGEGQQGQQQGEGQQGQSGGEQGQQQGEGQQGQRGGEQGQQQGEGQQGQSGGEQGQQQGEGQQGQQGQRGGEQGQQQGEGQQGQRGGEQGQQQGEGQQGQRGGEQGQQQGEGQQGQRGGEQGQQQGEGQQGQRGGEQGQQQGEGQQGQRGGEQGQQQGEGQQGQRGGEQGQQQGEGQQGQSGGEQGQQQGEGQQGQRGGEQGQQPGEGQQGQRGGEQGQQQGEGQQGQRGGEQGQQPGEGQQGQRGGEQGQQQGQQQGEGQQGQRGGEQGQQQGEGQQGQRGGEQGQQQGEGQQGQRGGEQGQQQGEGQQGQRGGEQGQQPGEGQQGQRGGERGQQPGEGQQGQRGGEQGQQPGEGQQGQRGGEQGQQPGEGQQGQRGGEQGQQPGEGKQGQRGGEQGQQQDEGQQGTRDPSQQQETGDNRQGGQQQGNGQRRSANGEPSGRDGAPMDAAEGAASGQPGTGTPTGGQEPPPPDDSESSSSEDQANVDYAKKATKLALDYLRHGADQELLDELGWTQQDLNRFIQRWDQLHSQGDQQDVSEEGGESFDDVLRSLGLSRESSAVRQHTDITDAPGNVTDRGTRSRPPSEYLDSYKAYLRRRQKEQGGQ